MGAISYFRKFKLNELFRLLTGHKAFISAVWNTTKINREVADYEVLGDKEIGLSWGRHRPHCIERNGDFWHSYRKTGDRGVRVTFKEKVLIRSFEFQTRQDAVKFKINMSF